MSVKPLLLVSVRDATEAEAARAGHAMLIDVKEPSRGPLGRADATVIEKVANAVGEYVPVSASLGELRDCPLAGVMADLPSGVDLVKFGLAGMLHVPWKSYLTSVKHFIDPSKTVAASYADWVAAEAPRPADIVAYACEYRLIGVLIDTFRKDGSTLLDWLSVDEIAKLVEQCRAGKLLIALAGSLGPAEIEQLLPLAPDWFAVRGAACEGGRGGRVTAERVRALADLLKRG